MEECLDAGLKGPAFAHAVGGDSSKSADPRFVQVEISSGAKASIAHSMVATEMLQKTFLTGCCSVVK